MNRRRRHGRTPANVNRTVTLSREDWHRVLDLQLDREERQRRDDLVPAETTIVVMSYNRLYGVVAQIGDRYVEASTLADLWEDVLCEEYAYRETDLAKVTL